MFAGRPSAIRAGKVANVPPPASAFIAPPSTPAPAARRIKERSIKALRRPGSTERCLLFLGEAVELGAALLLGRGLELAAGGVDVAAAGTADRRRDAGLEDDVAEALHALVVRRVVGRAGPGIERDQIDLGRQLVLADQA